MAIHEATDQVRERACVDLVDLGPPDLNQMHVINSRSSIALVKYNACNLILQLANDGVTRGDLWMVR